ncbi:hypothetical protein [Orlajensenia flava]|uniref:hypothetical protein n=1 Tax=Orlajensenia flava TaxID=2565934 RepID=UPI001A9BDF73|nr:hypothetical protein [Glaciibacter flavus]
MIIPLAEVGSVRFDAVAAENVIVPVVVDRRVVGAGPVERGVRLGDCDIRWFVVDDRILDCLLVIAPAR